jgi:Memo-like protein
MLLSPVSPPILRAFAAIEELKKTGKFSEMDLSTDEDEHSIEMHLPYVRKIFEGYVTPLYPHEPRNKPHH